MAKTQETQMLEKSIWEVTFSILTGGLINKEEAEKELTVHQKILLLDRRNLARLLCNLQGKSYSYGKLEDILGETVEEYQSKVTEENPSILPK